MSVDHRSLSYRALSSAVALSLVAGMMPVSVAFAATSSSNSANSESAAGENSSASNTNSGKNASSSSSNTSSSSSKSSSTNKSSTSKNSSSKAAGASGKDDPYESSYKASNAESGESHGTVTTIAAATADEAAVLQTSTTWEQSNTVVLIPDNAGAETLCAASLAGALGCPVLFLTDGQVSDATCAEIARLGATKAIVIANSSYDTSKIETKLQALPAASAKDDDASEGDDIEDGDMPSVAEDEVAADDETAVVPMTIDRIKGASSPDIALAVAQYGRTAGLWSMTSAIIANGSDSACAKATSAFAYRLAQPVILTAEDGKFPSMQTTLSKNAVSTTGGPKETLLDDLENIVVLAEDGRVPDSTIDGIKLLVSNPTKSIRTQNLAGTDAYEVNYRAESWYASTHPLSWESSIVVNVDQPSSVTAGIMAARLGVAQLATPSDSLSASAEIPASVGAENIVLSGERSVVDTWTLHALRAYSGFYTVTTEEAGITIDAAADREVDSSIDTDGVAQKAKDDILEAMDPGQASRGSANYYEFALLDEGYSGAVTADQINAFIDSIAGSYEASYGTTSLLRGTGQAFVDAAKESGVNEVYLLANAILESACGCSQLAQGSVSGAHNFFGIAAYDSNPDAGAAYAASEGWDTPEAAIKGGGKWISEHFIHSSYGQNTLYRMRYNVPLGSHQYASGLEWALSIAKLMDRCYEFCGISLEHTGLNFKVEVYSEL